MILKIVQNILKIKNEAILNLDGVVFVFSTKEIFLQKCKKEYKEIFQESNALSINFDEDEFFEQELIKILKNQKNGDVMLILFENVQIFILEAHTYYQVTGKQAG